MRQIATMMPLPHSQSLTCIHYCQKKKGYFLIYKIKVLLFWIFVCLSSSSRSHDQKIWRTSDLLNGALAGGPMMSRTDNDDLTSIHVLTIDKPYGRMFFVLTVTSNVLINNVLPTYSLQQQGM